MVDFQKSDLYVYVRKLDTFENCSFVASVTYNTISILTYFARRDQWLFVGRRTIIGEFALLQISRAFRQLSFCDANYSTVSREILFMIFLRSLVSTDRYFSRDTSSIGRRWGIVIGNADLSPSAVTWWSDSGHVVNAAWTWVCSTPEKAPSVNWRFARYCSHIYFVILRNCLFSLLRFPKVEWSPVQNWARTLEHRYSNHYKLENQMKRTEEREYAMYPESYYQKIIERQGQSAGNSAHQALLYANRKSDSFCVG